MTLKGLGRLAEAEVAFREAIALKPEAAELHLNLGTVLMVWAAPMMRSRPIARPWRSSRIFSTPTTIWGWR